MDLAFARFEKASKGKLISTKLVEASTVGRTYLAEVDEKSPLEDVRLHFTLVQRHLVISKLATLVRKKHDYVLFEANPQDKIVHRYQIEILRKNDKDRIKSLADMLYQLKHVSVGSAKFEDEFLIRVNDEEFFKAIFSKSPQVVKYLYGMRRSLLRLSYYPLSVPSIRFVAELEESFNPSLILNTIIDLTSAIADLGNKGHYAKKRSSETKIRKDPSLEKDKREFR